MTFRLPQRLSGHLKPETGWSVIDYELHQQKAQTLGDLGAQVEQVLAALRAFDAAEHGDDRDACRADLVHEAAQRVWAFMVQREICGLRHWDAVVGEYRIPGEVLSRLGQVRRKGE
jgi:hypothetical protein